MHPFLKKLAAILHNQLSHTVRHYQHSPRSYKIYTNLSSANKFRRYLQDANRSLSKYQKINLNQQAYQLKNFGGYTTIRSLKFEERIMSSGKLREKYQNASYRCPSETKEN